MNILKSAFAYRFSLIILIAIALKIFIMNPPTSFYVNGCAISLFIFSLAVIVRTGRGMLPAAMGFASLMGYTIIDNISLGMKEYTLADTYWISCAVGATIVSYIPKETRDFVRPVTILKIAVLIILSVIIIGGRNYVPLFQWLRIPYTPDGYVWMQSDAVAWVIAGAYAILNARGVEKVTGTLLFMLSAHNLIESYIGDPTKQNIEEWILAGYILLFIVWLYIRYKSRNNQIAVQRLTIIAITFHAYLVTFITGIFIHLGAPATIPVKVISELLLLALITMLLKNTVWNKRYI